MSRRQAEMKEQEPCLVHQLELHTPVVLLFSSEPLPCCPFPTFPILLNLLLKPHSCSRLRNHHQLCVGRRSLQWQGESGRVFTSVRCRWHFSQELISIRGIHSTLWLFPRVLSRVLTHYLTLPACGGEKIT